MDAGWHPYSSRFGDRYHSEFGGLDQHARFSRWLRSASSLGRCSAVAHSGDRLWLRPEFPGHLGGMESRPRRPRILHFVSVEAYPVSREDLLAFLPADEELRPLGEQLAEQWWGLLPGVHRLSFDDGQVLLTLL
jgi:tRNA 5-methylaminomethyl-2-thiouridine biosynthesis bifunctional protein